MYKIIFTLVVGSLFVGIGGCKPGTYYPYGGPPKEKATLFYTGQAPGGAVQLPPVKHDKKEVVVPG